MFLKISVLTISVLVIIICEVNTEFDLKLHRNKRYLVYPDGGPARAQFILGLGIPIDLKEQAVTVGTVIKFQYDLPSNSTEYTSRIYGFSNTISRGIDDNIPDVKMGKLPNEKINTENFDTTAADVNKYSVDDDSLEDDNDTLVDINFSDETGVRKKRALIYTEGGTINGNNNGLNLEEAIEQQEIIDRAYEEEPPRRANRWDYYKVIENMVERYGYSGRPCLLRTICEAAEVPFTHQSGLLGEIGHVLFTPSSTKDELSHHTDNEYHAAERLGREEGIDCEALFPECESSILETFTQIGLNTMHTFGLY